MQVPRPCFGQRADLGAAGSMGWCAAKAQAWAGQGSLHCSPLPRLLGWAGPGLCASGEAGGHPPMNTMQGAKSAASWNSVLSLASLSPARG